MIDNTEMRERFAKRSEKRDSVLGDGVNEMSMNC